MSVLIVEHDAAQAAIWADALAAQGYATDIALNQADAIRILRFKSYDIMVLQLILPDGGAIALADYACYRNPDVAIVTLTAPGFFSDGSIFQIIPNARSILAVPVPTEDLLAIVDHVAPQTESTAAIGIA